MTSGARPSSGEAVEGGGAREGEGTERPEKREERPASRNPDGACLSVGLPVCQPIILSVFLSISLCFGPSEGKFLTD